MHKVNGVKLTKASFAILLTLFAVALPALARADDLTGQSQDDPKDLLPTAAPTPRSQTTSLGLFQPLPIWARGVVLPPLPDQLKPMGKKPAVAAASSSPAPQPLAPPPETTTASSETDAKPKAPAPAVDNNPDLIAVSPFLQWIKSNPQAAAAEARQQANSYHPSTTPKVGSAGNPGGNGAIDPAESPYWLPPLIDSADFGTRPVTGSAAIYQTPQR